MKHPAIASPPEQPTRKFRPIAHWRDTMRHRGTRASLMELDHHLLRDIGLGRDVLLYSSFMEALPQTPSVRTTWISLRGRLPWR
jgi:uncharacterized protein YjiS (DUF1127 family)